MNLGMNLDESGMDLVAGAQVPEETLTRRRRVPFVSRYRLLPFASMPFVSRFRLLPFASIVQVSENFMMFHDFVYVCLGFS